MGVSCGVGRRCSLDLALLWRRPAAVALTRTPSLGTSVYHGCSPKKQKNKKWRLKLHYHKIVPVLEDFVIFTFCHQVKFLVWELGRIIMYHVFFTFQCNRMEFGIVPIQLPGSISMLIKIRRLFARVSLVSRYVYQDFFKMYVRDTRTLNYFLFF